MSEYSGFISQANAAAPSAVVGNVDANPDDAARSLELEKSTGTPAAAIFGDIELFEKNHQAMIAGHIVQNNPFLRDYINSHPLAAPLSNGDYGNLDAASQKATVLTRMIASQGAAGLISTMLPEALREGWHRFTEGYGFVDDRPPPYGSWISDKDREEYPLTSSALTWAGALPEELLRTLSGLISGATGFAYGGAKSAYTTLTGDEAGAKRFARDIAGAVEMQLTGFGVHAVAPPANIKFSPKHIEALRASMPWLENGLEPPRGLHPEIDKLKVERNKVELDALDEDLKESTASATRERSPDMYANFMRQHFGNGKIGIAGERVVELYGDKVPHAEDNLLGWVPGIKEQLEAARETGQDVQVPIADWLARVEPDLAKELHDDVRVRPGNITKAEAENPLEVTHVESPLAQARGASGLEPMFSIGDRKLTLERLDTPELQAIKQKLQMEDFHDFELKDENGRSVGTINLSSQKDGKQLYIEMINGINGLGPRDFGPSLMRDILRQLKEQFPEAESITGHRVSGAREKAGTFDRPSAQPVVKLSVDDWLEALPQFRQLLEGGEWNAIPASGINAYFKPLSGRPEIQQKLVGAVNELAGRIMGKEVSVQPVEAIRYGKINPDAAFIPERDAMPLVLYTLGAKTSPFELVRHEALHYLRQYGMLDTTEWATLQKAAQENGWVQKYNIQSRYKNAKPELLYEEAIAEAFRDWANQRESVVAKTKSALGMQTPIERVFQKIKDFFDSLRESVKDIIGKDATWEDLFEKIELGEIGKRERGDLLERDVYLSKDDISDMLRANATGLDLKSFQRLQKLIEQRHREDYDAALARAQREQTKRQSEEWKTKAAELRPQVVEDIRARPDIAADEFLRSGELFGQKLDKLVRLRAEDLTPEQAAALPKSYVAKSGAPIDEVANLFGFRTGEDMVQRLAALNEQRAASKKNPDLFRRQLIDDELNRRMEREHGFLEKNILEEAQDQALSKTQLDILTEEYHAAGMMAKVDTIDRAVIQARARNVFSKQEVGNVSSKSLLDHLGRLGRETERSLIAGKPIEAVKLMEQRVLTAEYVKLAQELEKDLAKFDKLADRFKRPFDPQRTQSIDPHYNWFIRDILGKLERPNGIFGDNLALAIDRAGYRDINDFISRKESDYAIAGLEIPVADFLRKPDFKKAVEELTVEQFNAAKLSVDSLYKLGREEHVVNIRGAKEDLHELGTKASEQLANKFEPIDYGVKRPGVVKDVFQRALSASTNNETLMRRFDGRDSKGLFTRTITYPAAEAANHYARLHREYAGKYSELGPIEKGNVKLDSPLVDPITGQPLTGVTRKTLATIISNMGNEYNWNVLTKGWKIDPQVLWDWVEKNSTVEDVQRAQKLGRIFDDAKGKSDTMYENMYGGAPPNIEVRPFEMHGVKFDGWYHPIIRDPIRSRHANELIGIDEKGGPKADNNFWPSTSNSYTKRRTGAIDVIDLTYDFVPMQLNQMLHDVAYRSFVYNTAKLFKSGHLLDNVTKYYGKPYADEMNMWLNRIAGNASYNEAALSSAVKLSNDIRQNVISTYIAFGLTTVQKHGLSAAVMSARQVGTGNFVKTALKELPSLFGHTVMDMFGKSEALGDTLHKFVLENSEEIQRRSRNWEETIRGQQLKLEAGMEGVASGARSKVIEWGSSWVAKSDQVSAEPTWLAKYTEVFAETADHGQSVAEADAAVRLAHGSTSVTNLPRIASGSGILTPWMTTLYGFFGTNMQRRIEIAHDINDAFKLGKEGEIKAAAKMTPKILGDIMTYVVWVGIVEEVVHNQFTESKDHGKLYHALAFTVGTLASTIIGLRDLSYGLIHGREPGVGLISSPLHDIQSVIRDIKKDRPLSRENAGKFVQDTITVLGDVTGMAPKHVGTAIRYGMDVGAGVQRPKTAGDWYRGLVSGKQEKTKSR